MSKPSRPYVRDLQFRGVVEGLTYLDDESNPLCHYFGGIPFGLPPVGPFRFQKPRALPTCYRYGTKSQPGRFVGSAGLCPQAARDDALWDEDCLQSNIWVPTETPPDGGWPVLFFIHGGFLQAGSPNTLDLRAFLSDSPTRCIVVAPAYRLNVFGFLAAPELLAACPDFATNLGFWDQRLALQWTWENVSYFGGNPANISVVGYSAGAHSAFHQLAFDLAVPDDKAIIKRLLMLSNGPGITPRSPAESQAQFTSLLSALHIPPTLLPAEKLALLRALPAKSLLTAVSKLPAHQFRAVADSHFLPPSLLPSLTTPAFASLLLRRNIAILLGSCTAEHALYATHHPPPPGRPALAARLEADYPPSAAAALLAHYIPSASLPSTYRSWTDAFAHLYAAAQIHVPQSALAAGMSRHGAAHLLYRYRIGWRAGCVDARVPRSMGVTHTTDLALWFWGNGEGKGLTEGEKGVVREAVQRPLKAFLEGGEVGWGASGGQVRVLRADGSVGVEEDKGVEGWRALWGEVGGGAAAAKL